LFEVKTKIYLFGGYHFGTCFPHISMFNTIPLSGPKVTVAFHASSVVSDPHFLTQAKILLCGMRRQNTFVYID
jgi:hypothetical protein